MKREGERSSMVEYQLPKLVTGVRFPSLAPGNMKLLSRRPKTPPLRAEMDGAGFRSDELKLPALARRASFTFLLILVLSGCKTIEAPYTTSVSAISGVYHYVKSGETLWSISKLYDINIKSILNANNIHDTTYITRGQKLLIPGASIRPERQKIFSYSDSFVWPLRGAVISHFGSKMDRTRNKGIDIKASEGSSVKASKAGKVVFCDEWLKGFGKTVILDHGDNSQTVYAYNSMILVKPGDLVEQNSVIAKVGRGGRAKEPSLHFEIRRDGEPQNPFYYLSN